MSADYGDFKRQWDGAIQALKGNAVWDIHTRSYIPLPAAAIPANPAPTLSVPGPNSTDARLQHVQMLLAVGSITDQDAAFLRKQITSGM